MATHKLVPYSIRIYEKHNSGDKVLEEEYFDLNSLSIAMPWKCPYSSFISLLIDALEETMQTPYIDDDSGRTLSAIDLDDDPTNNEIEAILSKGNFGDPGDHLDTIKVRKSGNTIKDARDPDALDKDTALEKRYHLLYKTLDNNSQKGLMMLHARGNGGVKTDLERIIKKKLSNIHEDAMFSMKTVTGGDLYEKMLENPITGFEILETQVDSDAYLKESQDLGKAPEKNRVTVNISAGSDGYFDLNTDKLQKLANNKEVPIAEFLPNGNDKGTTSHKVEIQQNGRPRKLNLSNDQPTMEQPISTDINYDEGRPEMESVGYESRRFASEVMEEDNWGDINTANTLIENTKFGD